MRSTRVPARRSLRVGGVALVAAAALTGCQWTSTIQTDQAYEPADGTSVTVGGLHVVNVVVVSEGEGAAGNVTGLAVNNTQSPLQVTVQAAGGGAAGPAITVPAGGSAQLTTPGGQAVTIPSVEPIAGAHVPLTISSAEGQTAVEAPILAPEGYYAPYGPGGGAAANATDSPTQTGQPTENPTAGPDGQPGEQPTDQPGANPTATATAAPTASPTP